MKLSSYAITCSCILEVFIKMTEENIAQILKKISSNLKDINISELLKVIRKALVAKNIPENLKRKIYMFSSNPEIMKLIKEGKIENVSKILKRLNITIHDLQSIKDLVSKIISENKEKLIERTPELKNPYFIYSMHAGRVLSPEEYRALLELSGLYDEKGVINKIVSLYTRLIESLENNESEQAREIIESLPKVNISKLTQDPVTLILLILVGYPKILYEMCTYQQLESTTEICDKIYTMLYDLGIKPSTEGIIDEIIIKVKRSLAFHYFVRREFERILTILKELEYIEESRRGRVDTKASIYNLYLHVYNEIGDKEKLREYINRLRSIVDFIASPYIKVAMYNSLGNYLQSLGDIQKALNAYNKGYEIAKRYNITFYADVIPHNIAIIKHQQGYYDEAEKMLLDVLKSRKEAGGTKYAISYVIRNLVALYVDKKDCKKAAELLKEIEQIGKNFADLMFQVENALVCAYYYMRCKNDPKKAFEVLTYISKDEKFIGSIRGSLKLSMTMAFAEAYYRMGNLEQALNYASLAHSYLRPYGDPWTTFSVSTLLAIIYLEKARTESPIYKDAAYTLINSEIEPLREKLGIIQHPLYDELKEKLKQ